MTTMNAVYLDAAEMIAAGREEFACIAIDRVVKRAPFESWSDARLRFIEHFEPTDEDRIRYEPAYCAWLCCNGESFKASREVRILALCLAACAL